MIRWRDDTVISAEGRKQAHRLTDKGREAYPEELERLRTCVRDGEEAPFIGDPQRYSGADSRLTVCAFFVHIPMGAALCLKPIPPALPQPPVYFHPRVPRRSICR